MASEPIINRVDIDAELDRMEAIRASRRAAEAITTDEIHAAELAALRDEVEQQRTRADAAEAELREMRKDRDAALLILPAGCGSLADAAETLRQELTTALDVITTMEDIDRIRDATQDSLEAIIAAQRGTIKALESTIESHERMAVNMAKINDMLGGAK